MADGPPEMIAINHDDYHARNVGHLTDGRQFLLTTPFDSARDGHPGSEFIALYLFDATGNFIEAIIDDLGPRGTLDEQKARKISKDRLAELGEATFDQIEVKPFCVERFGLSFGLIPRAYEDEDEEYEWAVELMPGNYMAFFEPWDSGNYDT